MPPLLEIVDAGKTYRHGSRSIPAFSGINLNVGTGEIVSVVGPSGCGKSSLLRTVAGLESLNHGRIILGETPIRNVDHRVGIVFQEPRLLPWLTVRDNVALPGRLDKNAHLKRDRSIVDDILDHVGLSEFATAFPSQISGGMAQRAALARTLVRRPDVILFDEPFAALDALQRTQLQTWVRDLLKERRTTALFVTHDIDEALMIGDRVAVLTPHPGMLLRIHRVSRQSSDHDVRSCTPELRERIMTDLKSVNPIRKESAS